MPFSIEDKIVIAVASSALFDLRESDAIFRDQGLEAYRLYQRENQDENLHPGVAFPFVRRILSVNGNEENEHLVEVILLSRNDPDTGLRIFKSIQHYNLNITRAAFLSGSPPYRYIEAFNASIFLSANEMDVREAVSAGFPAGVVLGTAIEDNMDDLGLRIAFDFDGVLADDEAETIFHVTKDLRSFHDSEQAKALKAHNPGPLKDLFMKIAKLQEYETRRKETDQFYEKKIRTAIITARNAPSHERVVTTLREWGIQVDETFFLGGMEKRRILKIFAPHIFFDDQRVHLDATTELLPSVHVPFGVKNQIV